MGTTKIVYGIDLGTTNSAITRFENGRAAIKKNGLQSDTTPSCVAYSKSGKVVVGSRARNQLEKDYALSFRNPGYRSNTYIEFKRLMGTDHRYVCANLGHEIAPEELSAEVLRELRKNVLDDNVTSAVITVPAMFNNTQKDATKRAAKMAGYEYVELIQEPVAASIAYGMNSKMKNAYWVVFDLGGGTFDTALMRIQDGIIQAIDTDGNNKLGGKDIDKAILDEIIIPYLRGHYNLAETLGTDPNRFANMWKAKAEEAKIMLSFNDSCEIETDLGEDYGTDDSGEELALQLTITQEELERISAPVFQKAIDITKNLLKRNNIDGSSLGALILVGGPTHSPILRKMLKEQVTPNVDTSIDPMTCVACGAAIYGSTIDVPEEIADAKRDRSKIQLSVNFQSTTVETEEWISVALLKDKCDNFGGKCVNTEFVRSDGMFTSPQQSVDEKGNVVSLQLAEGKTNIFDIRCYDENGTRLECEPSQITIIQGIGGVGDSILPMALGLGTMTDSKVEMFDPIIGLEKSRKLPATGIIRGLHIGKKIRPGVLTDEVRMSLYQIEDVAPNTCVLYCQRIYDVYLNGDDIPRMLPEGSEINLKLHAEKSGTIDKFDLEIPYLGMTIDLTERMVNSTTSAPSESFMLGEFANAREKAEEIDDKVLANRLNILEQNYYAYKDDRDTADRTLSELQAICRELDKEYADGEWDRQERDLKEMYAQLEAHNRKYGDSFTTETVDCLHQDMGKVIASKNLKWAKDLYNRMLNQDYIIAEVEYLTAWIYDWNRNFSRIIWKNESQARRLIDSGMQVISGTSRPTVGELQPIAYAIQDLTPDNQRTDILIH